jgi:phospholipase C
VGAALAAIAILAAVAIFAAGYLTGRNTRGQTAARPSSAPAKSETKAGISHVVVIVKENHTYDNYFYSLEGLDPSALPHCESRLEQGRCQYNEQDLPAYYRYVRDFGSGDAYFADSAGFSWPNHMMMIAGQTPLSSNPTPESGPSWYCPTTCYDLTTIADRLNQANVSWRNYGEAVFDPFRAIRHLANDDAHNVDEARFFEDVETGNMPAVAWVRPSYPESEHPGWDVRQGERWTVTVVNAIMRSAYWPTTAILVIWDDPGTGSDHVAPPATGPDGSRPGYGPRLPFIVIDAYTPSGFVSHKVLSHVSILKFLETLYHLQPLTARDGNATGLMDFFDFSRQARAPEIITGD